MLKYFVALGANIKGPNGEPLQTLENALTMIGGKQIKILNKSLWYQSIAFPDPSQPNFINACIQIECRYNPLKLLDILKDIELQLGRKKNNRWSSRVCDLDILACGEKVLPSTEEFNYWSELSLKQQKLLKPSKLILPHPRIQNRGFVLMPFADIASNWIHPVFEVTINQLLKSLPLEEISNVRPLSF